MKVLPLLLVSWFALGTVACSADAGDEGGTTEDEYRVKPGGTDTTPGKLIITSPVDLKGYDNARVTLPWEQGRGEVSMPMVLNQSFATKEGIVRLELTNRWGNVAAGPLVKAGTTVTFALGAVKVGAAPDFSKLAWGTEVGVWNPAWAGGSTFRDKLEWKFPTPLPSGRLYPQNELGVTIPTVPGTYHLTYGVFDGQDVVVSGGQVTDVRLGAPAQRRLGVLRAPVRELPECPVVVRDSSSPYVQYSGGLSGSGWVTIKGLSQGGRQVTGQQLMRLASGEEKLFGEYVGDPSISLTKTAYTFFLPNGLTVPVAIAAKPGDAPAVTTWGRLDVDDVDVTMDDGSTRKVRGTWSLTKTDGTPIVSWPTTTGQFKVPGCSTGTGIDLPFGQYKLFVRYTRQGFTQPATETYAIDLTP